MEKWMRTFENWEICDLFCIRLFKYLDFAISRIQEWALRNIGKRNQDLKNRVIEVANEILKMDTPSARWIAKDDLREL